MSAALLIGMAAIANPIQSAPAQPANSLTKLHENNDLPGRVVIAVLRATHQETGIPGRRLLRKYRSGTLTITPVGNDVYLVRIVRTGGNILEILIDIS